MTAQPPPSPTWILMLSDNSLSASKLEAELIGLDFPSEISSYRDLEEAHQAIEASASNPDLVLLEISKPDKGGFQILTALREALLPGSVPFLVVSSTRISSQDVHAGLNLGAEDLVTSPVDWRDVAVRIQAKVRVKKAGEALRSHTFPASDLSELVTSHELVALHQLILHINQYLEATSLLADLALLVKQYLNYPAVTTWWVDEGRNLSLVKLAGEENAPRASLLEIAPAEAAKTSRVASFSGSVDERSGDRFGHGDPPLFSSMAVPLSWSSRVGGILAVHSPQTSCFQESDRILLETISAQAGIVLERIELFRAVERDRQREANHFLKLSQLQSDFIATASHDLKNPIFAVLGYADLLERVGSLNDTQREFLTHIRHAGHAMQNLVINMLDLARLEIGAELQETQVNLAEMIGKLVEEFQPRKNEKQLAIIYQPSPEPVSILADPGRLHQAFRNLIDNAVKFTPQGGTIYIGTQAGPDQVTIDFRDTGIGIPADELPHIFEKFFRVHTAATQDIDGNGLGLAVVRSIVESHGGEISVESTEGEGSCFRVRLKRS